MYKGDVTDFYCLFSYENLVKIEQFIEVTNMVICNVILEAKTNISIFY